METNANKIHLFRSLERAEDYSKKLALEGVCFGHKCTTPLNFVLDLYKTIDSKTKIIDEVERLAQAISLISTADDVAYEYFAKPTNLPFFTSFVKKATSKENFVIADKVADFEEEEFSELELQAIDLAKVYVKTISAFGLIEIATAADVVSNTYKDTFDITFEDDCLCDENVYNCILNVAKESNLEAFNKNCFENVPLDDLDFSLCTLSEVKAKIPVFYELLKNSDGKKKIAIVTSDVEGDAASIAKLASNLNKQVRLEYTRKKTLIDTYFGNALFACFATDDDGPDAETAYCNFLHNRLSGVSVFECLELEKEIRLNPGILRKKLYERVDKLSPTFSHFMKLALDGVNCIDKTPFREIEKFIRGEKSLSKAEKDENIVALATYELLTDKLRSFGFDEDLTVSYILALSLHTQCVEGEAESPCQISVISPTSLNRLPNKSFDTVVFSDVSCATFNASTKFDALRTMLHKIGLEDRHSTSMISRINFVSGILASKDKVIFCLPVRDLRKGEVLTPSFVLQEFFFEKAEVELEDEKIDDACKKANIKQEIFGEEDIALIGNCETNDESEEVIRNVSILPFELLTFNDVSKFLRHTEDGTSVIMSPSEIESLCQCPYKWFYERRISPNSIDYEFNQAEKGNVIHMAFKLFYDELYSKGIYRLYSIDDVKAQNDLFLQCFHRATEICFGTEDGDLEEESKISNYMDFFELSRANGNCTASLAVQASMPKRYVVAESEMKISPDKNVKYAGVVINGCLDRLDVSQETDSFVIIDYKGSIKDHGCGISRKTLATTDIEEVPLPYKIQTLIYASCIKALTNKKCDATLYFSYNAPKKRQPAATGAVQEDMLEDFMFVCDNAKDYAVEMDMHEYLDATENKVAKRIENLLNGDIKPNPCSKKACEFCTVSNCPMRG